MTDARFPERWLQDRRVLRLSDVGFRLFTLSLAWSVSNRTDGVLYDDDLALIMSVDPARSGELEKADLWRREKDHWLIVDFADTQTSRHDLDVRDNARRREREKKARQRGKRPSPDSDVPGDSPSGRSLRTAQDRKGQDSTEEQEPTRTLRAREDVPPVLDQARAVVESAALAALVSEVTITAEAEVSHPVSSSPEVREHERRLREPEPPPAPCVKCRARPHVEGSIWCDEHTREAMAR
jgi:hypothetical protein